MAVTKPTLFPQWADSVSAVVTEPSGAKKTLGWVVEKPPYQYFNWLLNLIYQWILWFDQSNRATQTVVASGTTTLTLKSVTVFCNATAGAQSIQLPDVTGQDGIHYTVIKTDASANTVTILPSAGKTISGESSEVISNQFTAISMIALGGVLYMI